MAGAAGPEATEILSGESQITKEPKVLSSSKLADQRWSILEYFPQNAHKTQNS